MQVASVIVDVEVDCDDDDAENPLEDALENAAVEPEAAESLDLTDDPVLTLDFDLIIFSFDLVWWHNSNQATWACIALDE